MLSYRNFGDFKVINATFVEGAKFLNMFTKVSFYSCEGKVVGNTKGLQNECWVQGSLSYECTIHNDWFKVVITDVNNLTADSQTSKLIVLTRQKNYVIAL